MHDPYLNPWRIFQYGAALAGTIGLVGFALIVPRLVFLYFVSPSPPASGPARVGVWQRLTMWCTAGWSNWKAARERAKALRNRVQTPPPSAG